MQLDLAAERCGDPDFSRLIWMPPGLKPDDERQQALIDELQRSAQAGSEVLQTKLEDLKAAIQAKLAPKPKLATNGRGERGLPCVYLICDKQDYDDTKPLEDFLSDHGIEVLPPPLEGNQAQISQYHNREYAVLRWGNDLLWPRERYLGAIEAARIAQTSRLRA